MSHECPDCGSMCHCHGDIDDCMLDAPRACSHKCSDAYLDDDYPDGPDEQCGEPCPANMPCDLCTPYWDRMRREGFWIDGRGWTEKGQQSWTR